MISLFFRSVVVFSVASIFVPLFPVLPHVKPPSSFGRLLQSKAGYLWEKVKKKYEKLKEPVEQLSASFDRIIVSRIIQIPSLTLRSWNFTEQDIKKIKLGEALELLDDAERFWEAAFPHAEPRISFERLLASKSKYLCERAKEKREKLESLVRELELMTGNTTAAFTHKIVRLIIGIVQKSDDARLIQSLKDKEYKVRTSLERLERSVDPNRELDLLLRCQALFSAYESGLLGELTPEDKKFVTAVLRQYRATGELPRLAALLREHSDVSYEASSSSRAPLLLTAEIPELVSLEGLDGIKLPKIPDNVLEKHIAHIKRRIESPTKELMREHKILVGSSAVLIVWGALMSLRNGTGTPDLAR